MPAVAEIERLLVSVSATLGREVADIKALDSGRKGVVLEALTTRAGNAELIRFCGLSSDDTRRDVDVTRHGIHFVIAYTPQVERHNV